LSKNNFSKFVILLTIHSTICDSGERMGKDKENGEENRTRREKANGVNDQIEHWSLLSLHFAHTTLSSPFSLILFILLE